MQNREKSFLTSDEVEREILYWNLNAINNLSAVSGLIDRENLKQKPTKDDLLIRDFYFLKKLTIDGKFQPISFLERAQPYLGRFKSIDKGTYLQSLNEENNIKKHRFWKRILDSNPKTAEEATVRDKIKAASWAYRIPTLFIFGVLMHGIMFATGVTKLNRSKQMILLAMGALTADYYVHKRMSSEIFYYIESVLPNKTLESKRKQLVANSVVLDGKVFVLGEHLMKDNAQFLELAQAEGNQQEKKILLQMAGFQVRGFGQKII